MSANPYKKLVKKYFLALVVAVSAMIAFCYVMDPLQLFHKSLFLPENMLSSDMREQAAGLIKNYDFDSIILGTSQLENASAAEAAKNLGGKFMNISMYGSSFYERSFPLAMALRKGMRNVVFSLDENYMDCWRGMYAPPEQWAFLYDQNPFNDFIRYATFQNFINMFKPSQGLRKTDLDRPNAWFRASFHYLRFGGLEKWVENMDNFQVHDFLVKELPETAKKIASTEIKTVHNPEKEQESREFVDKYILDYVRKYPDTQFYLYFPPYPRYRFSRMLRLEPEKFSIHREIVRYMAKNNSELPNLHVFGFEDQDFLDDIVNYKDTLHHTEAINTEILQAMGRGEHELTADNVEKYLETSLQKAKAYDILKLNEEAQALIAKHGIKAKKES